MSKTWKRGCSLLVTGALLGSLIASSLGMGASAAEQQPIDANAPELKLVYTAPPKNMGTLNTQTGQSGDWNGDSWQQEALPIGNGFIGAMVFGDQVSGGMLDDRIQLNEHTLWSGGPGKNKNYSTDIFKNNGSNTTKEKVQSALRQLQESLQTKVTAFTKENDAHYAETGEFLNYPGYYTETDYMRDTEQARTENDLLAKIKGYKGDFGSYQSLGDIHIKNDDTSYDNYERGLDLNTATAWVTYTQNGATYKKEYFVSNPNNVLAIRLTAEGGKIDRTIDVSTVQKKATISTSSQTGTITVVGSPADQNPKYATNEKLCFAEQVKVITKGGTVTDAANGLRVSGADEVLILMSAATNYVQDDGDSDLYDFYSDVNPLDTVTAKLQAAGTDYDKLKETHVADYKNLFDRVKLNLCGATRPDKTTDQLVREYPNESAPLESRYLEELYYQYGRYLLISSSREGSLPANLQGIWADGLTPPWDADYHTNVNLQMNYWLAQPTNLDECQSPLNDYINSLVPYGEKTAQWYHITGEGKDGVRGWVDYHENNIWGYTNPAISEAYYAPEGAAWLCQALWEDYAFTQNKEELKENFNALLGSAIFWVDTLWTDERDGKLVANPTYSPEHGTYTLGATFTQSIIWQVFTDVGKAAAVLGDELTDEQKGMVKEVADALEKLYIPEVNEATGIFPEWKDMTAFDIAGTDTPTSPNKHRHTNQLAGLHPGSMVVAGRSDKDDEIVSAMRKTLENRGDGGTGWGRAWKMSMWARLRDGDHAYTMLNGLLKLQSNGGSTYQNLLDTHAPFQIDGNFGAVAGLTEMMLQSQGDSIDLFAAMPTAWDNGAVTGLKARGNFEIGMQWKDRKLQRASVTALSGGDCTISYKGIATAKIVKADGTAVEATADGKDKLTFATEAGQTYYVTEISQDIKLSSREVFMKANLNNLYSKDILKQTAAPDEIGDNGVFVESVMPGSMFLSLGIKENEILTALNGQTITDVQSLLALYNAAADGDTITLKVWGGKEYREVSFKKAVDNAYFHIPGQIEAEVFDGRRYEDRPKIEGDHLAFVDNGTWVRYNGFYFAGTPKTVSVCAAVQDGPIEEPRKATRTITVKIVPTGGQYSDAIKLAAIKVTGQSWSEYLTVETDKVTEVTPGAYDVFLDFNGGINVDWFAIGEPTIPDVPDVPTAQSLELTPPTKLVYEQGEALDLTGAALKVKMSDGTEQACELTAAMISGYDANALGEQTLTVTSDGLTTTFTVTVKAKEEPPVSTVYGDVNGDGAVDTADAVLVLQRAAKLIGDDNLNTVAADVNGDNTIDTADAVLILQKAAKLIEKFPVEG